MTPMNFPVAFPDADLPAIELAEELISRGEFPGIELNTHEGVPSSVDEWLSRIGGARGLLLSWALPDEVLLSAPNLEVISFLGTGITDHVDVKLAEQRGIQLKRVVGYGNHAVAEHALALLLSAWRGVPELDRRVRAGEWPIRSSRELRGARLAILGLGGIGRTMAHLGQSLGMDVVAWTRSHASGERERDGIPVVGLEEALEGADAVSLHLPYLPDTHHLVTDRHLELLRPGAILVNTARGGVLDSDALTRALDSGRVSTAALDVFEKEPLRSGHEWVQRDDVILTPHVAFNTDEAFDALLRGALENLVNYAAEPRS